MECRPLVVDAVQKRADGLHHIFFEAAADESSFIGPEKGDDPWVFCFIDIGYLSHIADKGTVGLHEIRLWQYLTDTIKGDRKIDGVICQMNDGFFLPAFHKKDILMRDVINTLGSIDAAVGSFALFYRVCSIHDVDFSCAGTEVFEGLFYFIFRICN